jgi:PGF-pre-PGF domain-containing protein
MMKSRILMSAALTVLLLVPSAFAASVSLNLGEYNTEVYKGTQFTVPVDVTISQSSGTTSVSVTILPKDGMSCDTCTKTVTFTSDGQQSTSFTLKGDTVGTYPSPFTVTATATGTSDTATGSNAVIIQETPTMQINFYNTTPPVKVGSSLWTFPVKMEITTSDTAFENVTVNLTNLISAHDMQIVSGPRVYNVGSIPAQSTVTLTWTFNVTGFSVYGISGSIITDKGSFDATFSDSYSTGGGTTISAGGGGGGGAGSKTEVVKKIDKIVAGEMALVTFTEEENPYLTELGILTKSTIYNVEIKADYSEEKPYSTMPDPEDRVYSYIKLTTSASLGTALEEGKIGLRVKKSWLKEMDINPESLVLNRLKSDNRYEKLETIKTGSDSDNIYLTATTTGFSYFVTTGEEGSGYVEEEVPQTTAPPVTTQPPPTTAPPVVTPSPKKEGPVPTVAAAVPVEPEEKGGAGRWITAILVIVIVIGAAAYVLDQKGIIDLKELTGKGKG